MQTVLVIGGAGFIGSQINKMLNAEGYNTIVFDNLSRGSRKAVVSGEFIKGDMANIDDLEHVFEEHTIDAVMHFGALIDVGESVREPAKYYINNVVNTINVLEVMRKHNVKYFIFSSTAAIFGNPNEKFIAEEHQKFPINPYGHTKLMVETILHDYDIAYGFKSVCLRYFNAAGGDPDREIKNFQNKENNLIPIILKNLKFSDGSVNVFGTDYPTPDGTCIRDYIHVYDLGIAHIKALKKILGGSCSLSYNLGNGKGFSVKEVIEAVEKTTGRQLNVVNGERRAGDPPFLLANAQKAAAELEWTPKYPDLNTMIEHAWAAINTENEGSKTKDEKDLKV